MASGCRTSRLWQLKWRTQNNGWSNGGFVHAFTAARMEQEERGIISAGYHETCLTICDIQMKQQAKLTAGKCGCIWIRHSVLQCDQIKTSSLLITTSSTAVYPLTNIDRAAVSGHVYGGCQTRSLMMRFISSLTRWFRSWSLKQSGKKKRLNIVIVGFYLVSCLCLLETSWSFRFTHADAWRRIRSR